MSPSPAPEPAGPRVAGTVAGIRPWLPWPLSRWRWWTEPVRAERLAALRIGLALVLLLDIRLTYIPHATDFFGRDSLGSPHLAAPPPTKAEEGARFFQRVFGSSWEWSLLRGVEDPTLIRAALWLWLAATFCLMLGLLTRLSAVLVWMLSTSVAVINPSIDNAGDVIRGIALLYLMLAPSGAAWSLDAWLRRRRGRLTGPAYVYPWMLRLLFLQMVFIYWCNGVYKATGVDWRSGQSLYYVLGDLALTRWSYAQLPLPYELTRILTWTVLGWELSFPLLVCWRPTRIMALLFGVGFHLGIGLTMELGGFAPYMLCLYLPLLPWERWTSDRKKPLPL